MIGPMRKLATFFAQLAPTVIGVIALILILMYMAGKFHPKVTPGIVEASESKLQRGQATAQVRRTTVVEAVPAVGTVQPRYRVDVASRIVATILAVHVDASDEVKKGDVLIELDDREIQAQLREAEAGVAAAQAEYDLRLRDYKRAKQLLEEKAISQEEFDRVEGMFEVARAQLERAKQQLERTQVVATYTVIRSPVDGIVSDRHADPGDLAVPGTPLLSIYNPSELELHANVRESLANRLKPGDQVQVRIDAADLTTTGTLREIVPEADVLSRAVTVKVSLPEEVRAGLYLGMFGRIYIPVGKHEVLVVPGTAIQYVGQLELVTVVRDDGTLERRFIRTGRHLDGDVEVLSGLREGERILLPGEDGPGA